MAKSKHIDGKKYKRQGYFEKTEDGMPDENYRDSCGDGFKGAEWDAHHVLPATAFKTSVGDLKAKHRTYVKNIQFITPWVINNSGNMLGMPGFRSFLFYYQFQDDQINEDNPKLKKAGENAKVKRYINTFNSQRTKSKRKEWLAKFATQNPEGLPIHRPVSWGHSIYNQKVKTDLKDQVWDTLNEQQKQHKTDAGNVAGLLDDLSGDYKDDLKARGAGTSRAKWDKRYRKNDNAWYKPFTMTDVPMNPLFK